MDTDDRSPPTTPPQALWHPWLRQTRRPLLRPALRLAVATGLLVALTGAVLSAATRTSPADRARAPALQQPAQARAVDDPAAAALMTRFALNALLATVIDDDAPPRWTDVAVSHICGPATRVEVDGRPMVPRTRIPARAFTVRWQMDQCLPFEAGALALSGSVELLVFHDDNGLSATVNTDRLMVTGDAGTARLPASFAAALSLDGSVNPE